ncbi:MAG: HPr family phosphocarrier protein [Desulfomonile tiedjei]|nr:HPr family phosphocarrier protein [Desulfomonile tiedjei]
MEPKADRFQKTLTVGNQLGIHARVATTVVQTMRNFASKVTVSKDGVEVDARSVLGLLLLAATPGSEIVVRAEGPDCRQAIEEIGRLITDEESQ